MADPSITDRELERVAAVGWQAPATEWLGVGCGGTYLQVDQANGVAHEMYRCAGFADHTYRYVDLPVTPRPHLPTGRSRRTAAGRRRPAG